MTSRPRPIFVSIAGPSGAGKSTLVRAMKRSLGDQLLAISVDNYYRCLAHLDPADRDEQNFDDPAAIDHRQLAQDLETLALGEPVHLPIYDFPSHTRLIETIHIEPARVIVVEGLFALCWPEINRSFDHSYFIEIDPETALRRIIPRDAAERGWSAEVSERRFREVVYPSYLAHVAPCQVYARQTLDGAAPSEVLADRILLDWIPQSTSTASRESR